jgi:hypothetical protein
MRKVLYFFKSLALLVAVLICLAELIALGIWLEQSHIVGHYYGLAIIVGLMLLVGAGALTWLRYMTDEVRK